MRPISSREHRRKLEFEWLRQGVPKAEIARRLSVSYTAVRLWERRQRTRGPNGWREARHPGPARKLTEEQHRRLRKILLEGAQAHGYATDLWTLKRVAEVVEKEFGKEYTEPGFWHVLRDLGFSAQLPLARAFEGTRRTSDTGGGSSGRGSWREPDVRERRFCFWTRATSRRR